MRTLLVITEQAGFEATVREAVSADLYRVIALSGAAEAEGLLRERIADACLLDVEPQAAHAVKIIQELRRRAPDCPLLVYAGPGPWDWEEEAWLLGITHLLAKPVRSRLLNALLDRLWRMAPAGETTTGPPIPPQTVVGSARSGADTTLLVMKNFSTILKHCLCARDLLSQFLLLLREVLGVNRAAVFLRQPPRLLRVDAANGRDRRLRPVSAQGLSRTVLEHFELSLDTGIGRLADRWGRILWRQAPEALADREAQREFELLGGQVAIPLMDRESLLGVAVFDAPVSGEPFRPEALSLVFHLLEELGLAVRNSWLHDQLADNHAIMLDMLNQIGSACLLVDRHLEILHANQTAVALFGRGTPPRGRLDFGSLPAPIASILRASLRPGAAPQAGKYRPPQKPGSVFRVTVTPFRQAAASVAEATLLVMEEITQVERAQLLEVESANLRLVRTMAEHLAHEIGNSLTPISAHQQMMAEHYEDPEFRSSLSTALDAGVQRIARLCRQMLQLASECTPPGEPLSVADLLKEAFEDTRQHFPDQVPQLKLPEAPVTQRVKGDRAALREALSEVLLNALQSRPENPFVEVDCQTTTAGGERPCAMIEVRDAGPGFTPEGASRATEPFYSTRVVGLGLGLTVARKIVEAHQGKLEILAAAADRRSCVRIYLPLTAE